MELIKLLLTNIILFYITLQISIKDLLLLKGYIIYKKCLSNFITYICICFALLAIGYDIYNTGLLNYISISIVIFMSSIVGVWIASKINSKSLILNTFFLLGTITIEICVLNLFGYRIITTAIFWAVYYQNTPMGAPFKKEYLILKNREKPFFYRFT